MPRGENSAVDPAPRRSARKDAAAAEVTSPAAGDDAADSGNQPKLWDALKVNRIVCFVLRGDNPAHLRTAEVISLSEDKRSGEFWYWIDHAGTYDPGKPLSKRRLCAEWADERGRTRVKPKPQQAAVWGRRQHALSIEDIEIIAPVINVRVGGTVAPDDVEKVDKWLRRAAKRDARARKAISVMLLREREANTVKTGNSDVLHIAMRSMSMTNPCTSNGVDKHPKTSEDTNNETIHRSIRELFARWDPWSAGWRGAPSDQAHSSKAAQLRQLCDEEPSVPTQCTAQYNRKTTQDRCSRSHPRHRLVEGSAKGNNKSTDAMRRLLTILTSELVSKTENPSRGRA